MQHTATNERRIPRTVAARWLTVGQVCEMLCVHQSTVYRKAAAGILERKLYGKKLLISKKSVNRYLKQF